MRPIRRMPDATMRVMAVQQAGAGVVAPLDVPTPAVGVPWLVTPVATARTAGPAARTCVAPPGSPATTCRAATLSGRSPTQGSA